MFLGHCLFHLGAKQMFLKYIAYKILLRKRFTNSAKYSEGETIFTPEEQQHWLFWTCQ
jgi:hypothetical protein